MAVQVVAVDLLDRRAVEQHLAPLPEEHQRREVLAGRGAVAADLRRDARPRLAGGDVEQQLPVTVPRQFTERAVSVHQADAQPLGLIEQRPERGAVQLGQVQAAVGVVRALSGVAEARHLPGTVQRVDVPGQLQMVLADPVVIDLPGVQRAPGQRPVDPPAAGVLAQQPPVQPRRTDAGVADELRRQFDRQRPADRLLGRREQGPQRQLPVSGRSGPRRLDGIGFGELVGPGDHQGHHVLAVTTHRTAAVA